MRVTEAIEKSNKTLFTFEILPQLKGHLWGEWFEPGDYYASEAENDSFLRLNLEYSF